MFNDKLVHDTLTRIDWNYVLDTFRRLKLSWYENKIPSKNDLILDLADLMKLSQQSGKEVSTEHWIINYWVKNEKPYFEIVFTPMVIVTTLNPNMKEIKVKRLKDRLSLALSTENYELAGKIKKNLDKLNKIKVQKISQ